jgi:hypothetical protein
MRSLRRESRGSASVKGAAMGSVERICRRQRAGLEAVALPALAALALALASLALAGCGTTTADANEPNDEPRTTATSFSASLRKSPSGIPLS